MKQIKIKTSLVGKDELFKILALGHSCPIPLPILLVGEVGVAKSKAITDYLESIYGNQSNLTFSIQLSDFTKGSDITGKIDMAHFVKHQEMVYNRPICSAKGIYIDEVGRGSSSIRNVLLSIMNEKRIISGSDSCDMNWDLFVGSTNTIPTEESNDAFWDRMVIKYPVLDTSIEDIAAYMINPVICEKVINFPEQEDFDKIKFQDKHLKAFAKLAKTNKVLSDRTLTKIPYIAKCVKIIWGLSNEYALGQTCKLLCPSIADQLMNQLISTEQRELNDLLNVLKNTVDANRINKLLVDLSNLETRLYSGKSASEQAQIKQQIEDSIKDSDNEGLIDKYLARENLTQSIPFILQFES